MHLTAHQRGALCAVFKGALERLKAGPDVFYSRVRLQGCIDYRAMQIKKSMPAARCLNEK